MKKLSIGIVGLPNVGKSTLFKIITKNEVNIANYPFCTIDPNIGVVTVPDERLEKLGVLSKSKKIIPAVVEFYDIAGLVKGANKGEGLGNKFLSHIRETSVVLQVLRCFADAEIIHVENSVDPLRDLEIVNTELVLKDLETVEKALPKIEADAKGGKKEAQRDFELLQKVEASLKANKLVIEFRNEPIMRNLQLLTSKKQIYLLNGKPEDVSTELKKKIEELGATYVIMDLKVAENIPELIAATYDLLGLISFLTTGEDETRAWTIEKGMKAPAAAGVIHTDFEHKFIRAEVIHWQKLLEAGAWSKAREKGWIRQEGKEYIVQDGDVMVIKHG